jgi:ATP-dependent Clp protease ATP-binding subunit ClpA
MTYGLPVLELFSDAARRLVVLAEEEARRLGHGHIGTEHLLLGIMADEESGAARALVAAGATLDACRVKVAEAVSIEGTSNVGDLPFTDRAKRTLERASRLSLRRHDEHVEPEHVLLSLLDIEGTAGQVLRGLAVDLVRLRASVEAPADPERTRDSKRGSPRCAACGSDLESALAHCVVTSHGRGQQGREFVVAYCSACGSAISATAV